MQIKLYVFPGGEGLLSVSPPCVRVQLALARCEIPYENVYLKTWAEAAKFSATGRLPAIDFDDERFSDSFEILDELERRFPDAEIGPKDPTERMRDRLWEHYVNDHLYWLGYYMRWVDPESSKLFIDGMLKHAPFMMRLIAPRMMNRFTRRRSREVGILGKSREEVLRAFERSLDMFDAALVEGPYLEGRDRPGRGDLGVASMVCQTGFRGTMPEVERRVRERPAILDHTRRVFKACNSDLPRWMAE